MQQTGYLSYMIVFTANCLNMEIKLLNVLCNVNEQRFSSLFLNSTFDTLKKYQGYMDNHLGIQTL